TLLASARSAGKPLEFREKELTVEELTPESFHGIDIALFSAGGSISKEFAPIAANTGCIVIDNSSAFRMDLKLTSFAKVTRFSSLILNDPSQLLSRVPTKSLTP
ncbi:hypothetical protein N9Z10_06255, partial [Akkermansiaceae bacterium]|nr:hypothetical protein [Akkermansiaceae bacterium]